MHRCLAILEIIEQICSYLKGSDLVSVALTQKQFKAMALSFLWKELPSLLPLVKCFPSQTWREARTSFGHLSARKSASDLVQRRPIVCTDWEAVYPYLRFVQVIKSDPSLRISDELLQSMILSFPGPLIFPNLRHLVQHQCTASMGGFLKLCASPKLEYLDITFRSNRTEDVQPSLISALGILCPNVKTFLNEDIECMGLDSPSSKALSGALLQWRSLMTICAPCISDEAMIHISQLPELHSLTLLGDRSTFTPVFPEVPKPAFPAVRHLELRRTTPSYLMAFHESISSSEYRSFRGILQNACRGSEWSSLLTQLARISSRIESITYEDDQLDEFLAEHIIENEIAEHTITPEIMRPILVFKDLRHLDMDSILNFDLSDDFIEEISLACTKLEYICFGTQWLQEGQSKLTFNSYLCLVRHCPRITTIGLIIDASRPDLLPRYEDTMSHRKEKLNLFVGDSEIQGRRDMDAAVAFLMKFVVYPHQIKQLNIQTSNDCPFLITDRWDEVTRELSDLIHNQKVSVHED